ncbi:MNIO family bufferin maturase [Trinickia sp.]|uniref:MNIO family bufferin maturase n=1 Tax=Trinickia sp. TaxID=2571163 RepID=UPI003F7E989A
MNASLQSAAPEAYGRSRRTAPGAAGLAGASFKHAHLAAILEDGLPDGFFEVHAENYMGAGGPVHRALTALREHYPISLHGVGMSIGGPNALDRDHLARFRALVARYEPRWVSEHLAWSSHGGAFFNDLLPLPYTDATLDKVCEHIDEAQEAIGRTMLLENPSTYLTFASSTMSEPEFIRAVAQRTGCALLLDVNNVFVSATNHGYSALDYLAQFPLEHVGEIHLAGHSEQRDDEDAPLLIDSHDRAVAEPVWALYRSVIETTGPVPTLVEWDSDLPSWPELRMQAMTARQIMTDRAGHDALEPRPAHSEPAAHEA